MNAARWLIFVLAAGAFQEDPRKPVPDAAAQKEAEKLIRDLFKEEYAKRSPADRLALSRKLFQQASDSKDAPGAHYVLLRESADLAAETQDLAGCLRSLEELAKNFRVDAPKLKLGVLTAAIKSARTAEENIALCGHFLRLADDSAWAEDFDTAKKAVDSAATLARKGKDIALLTRVQAKDKELAELKGRSEKVKKARETLASKPDDAASSLVVGQHECFTRGNWKEGLRLLASGTDGPLKELAAKDLADPADAAQQTAVGDGWWDLSEKENAPALKEKLRARAHSWYEKAIRALTGLSKAKVDKRLKVLRMEMLHRGSWVDISDPKSFGRNAKPGDPIEITEETIVAKMPPGEFDGVFVRARLKKGSMTVIFEPRRCASWIQTVNPHIMTGRYNPDESRWEPEGAQIIPVVLEDELPITVLLVGGEYVVYLHSEVKGRLKASRQTLAGVELESFNGTVIFDSIRLRRKE